MELCGIIGFKKHSQLFPFSLRKADFIGGEEGKKYT